MKIIRGAITIDEDKKEKVLEAAEYLMNEIVIKNSLKQENIISIITTTTRDICSSYPGPGIRNANIDVPIICVQEQYVENSLEKCIRFVVYAEIDYDPSHVYVGKARSLRPDLFVEGKWL